MTFTYNGTEYYYNAKAGEVIQMTGNMEELLSSKPIKVADCEPGMQEIISQAPRSEQQTWEWFSR